MMVASHVPVQVVIRLSLVPVQVVIQIVSQFPTGLEPLVRPEQIVIQLVSQVPIQVVIHVQGLELLVDPVLLLVVHQVGLRRLVVLRVGLPSRFEEPGAVAALLNRKTWSSHRGSV